MSKLLAIVQRMSRSYSEDGYNAGIAIKYKRGEFGIYLNIIYLYELSRT